jgi:SnoaL-like domain
MTTGRHTRRMKCGRGGLPLIPALVREPGWDRASVQERAGIYAEAISISEQNVEIVRRVHEAFNARDVKAVLELVRPAVEWRPALFGGGIVETAVYRGHEGIVDFLKVQEETWETSARPTRLTIEFWSRCISSRWVG